MKIEIQKTKQEVKFDLSPIIKGLWLATIIISSITLLASPINYSANDTNITATIILIASCIGFYMSDSSSKTYFTDKE